MWADEGPIVQVPCVEEQIGALEFELGQKRVQCETEEKWSQRISLLNP